MGLEPTVGELAEVSHAGRKTLRARVHAPSSQPPAEWVVLHGAFSIDPDSSDGGPG